MNIKHHQFITTYLRNACTGVAQLVSDLKKDLKKKNIPFQIQVQNITRSTLTTLAITLQSLSLIFFNTLWWLWYSCLLLISNRAGFRTTNRSNMRNVEFQRVFTSCLNKKIHFPSFWQHYLSKRRVQSGSKLCCTARRSLQKLFDRFACAQMDLNLQIV